MSILWMHSHCAFLKNGFWNGTPKSIHNSFSDISFVSFFSEAFTLRPLQAWKLAMKLHAEPSLCHPASDHVKMQPWPYVDCDGLWLCKRSRWWVPLEGSFFKTSVMAGNNTDQGRPKLLWEIIGWQAPWTQTSTTWLTCHQRIRFANSYSLWLMLEAQIVGNSARLCKDPPNRYRKSPVHSIPK